MCVCVCACTYKLTLYENMYAYKERLKERNVKSNSHTPSCESHFLFVMLFCNLNNCVLYNNHFIRIIPNRKRLSLPGGHFKE